ncbi:MAG: malto-oligosyltrehalose synthase, partial [Candidatus Binatia bacterium]
LHTSWINDDQSYDDAIVRFVEQTLDGRRSRRFLASFLPFQQRIALAGIVNSLAQLVLKLASPGVADFYQGSELWDLSLADPDNRRPVDFDARRRLLGDLAPLLDGSATAAERSAAVAAMLTNWQDGRIKLYLTACGLRLRRGSPELFLRGEYVPLEAAGDRKEHVIGFARRHAGERLVVIVPRLATALTRPDHPFPLGESSWRSAQLLLPKELRSEPYTNLFTGEQVSGADRGEIPLADIFRTCPVAALV